MVEHIGVGLKGQLLISRGDIEAGIPLIRQCQEALPIMGFQISNVISLASGLSAKGDFEGALREIDQLIIEGDRLLGCQHGAEILRVKGNILACASETNSKIAEQWLLEAAEIARRKSALSWELRITTSLAALWKKRGHRDEARETLAAVYGRFTEGFDTLDLRTAKRLLDGLD